MERLDGVYKFENLTETTLIQFIEWAYTGDYTSDACFDLLPGLDAGANVEHS